MAPLPPSRKQKRPGCHYDASFVAKVHDGKELLDHFGAKYTNRHLFEYFGVNERTGYRILKEYPNRLNNICDETRGRKRLLSKEQVDQMEQFLMQETRTLPWQDLPNAAGLEISGRNPSKETVRSAMNARGWHKCKTCPKFWVTYDTASQRESFARIWLDKLGPDPANYRHIRYSTEVHFKFGPEGKVTITTSGRPGEKYCPDCIHRTGPTEAVERQTCVNAWACVGYNFKSYLIFYQVDNSYGAITLEAYRDQVLEPYVKKWIEGGERFVLEDGAIGHGGRSDNNIIRQWKEEVGLDYFFGCPGGPLAPIENCWKAPKQTQKKNPIWDESALRTAALEGWAALEQSTINEWCDSVPSRLLDVVNAKGQDAEH